MDDMRKKFEDEKIQKIKEQHKLAKIKEEEITSVLVTFI